MHQRTKIFSLVEGLLEDIRRELYQIKGRLQQLPMQEPISLPAYEVRPRPEKMSYCHFCGKSQDEVQLIAGPAVFICDECVDLCSRMIAERAAKES